MAMEVDPSVPLTDEARRYLLERGRNDQVAAIDARHAEVEGDDEEEGDEEVETYASWKKADLVNALQGRDLDTSGKVEELRARLMEDDAERRAAEDDEEEGDSE